MNAMKTMYRNMDLETYMLLNSNKFKDTNKKNVADYISYFHIFLILNTILSFFYPYRILHQLNLFLQVCNYTDWIHNSYCITHYGKKDDCIVTRAENIFRTLDSREREEKHRESKETDKGEFKKFKPTQGYIKTIIYEKTGFIVPSNWVKIFMYSWSGASIYNSFQLL